MAGGGEAARPRRRVWCGSTRMHARMLTHEAQTNLRCAAALEQGMDEAMRQALRAGGRALLYSKISVIGQADPTTTPALALGRESGSRSCLPSSLPLSS